ncbi:hypothetical protein CSQ87_04170 [Bifidobacterium simiarum]|uniref:Uncharacterized protein n=2 Tax=Bifidobacterium simiarum TaxID=2045441 RepID=A0A2M9HFM3_9BIFI|nr:hypothetical protein CSQ87_04170 [Bifidobacterium simiarum]
MWTFSADVGNGGSGDGGSGIVGFGNVGFGDGGSAGDADPFAVTAGDPSGAVWNEVSHTLVVRPGAVLTLSMASGYENGTDGGRIVVEDGAHLTLDGVRINVSARRDAAALLVDSGRLDLVLAAGSDNRLWSGADRAGLENGEHELVIVAAGPRHGVARNVGRLSACSYSASEDVDGAGIGGAKGERGANITINGGVIEAFARADRHNAYGAGIGGGRGSDGGNVLIGSGTVTAGCRASRGMAYGAGIGGGYGGSGTDITIRGGEVAAWSRGLQGSYGAGVGGGQSDDLFGGGTGGMARRITVAGGRLRASGNVPVGSGLWGGESRDISVAAGTMA